MQQVRAAFQSVQQYEDSLQEMQRQRASDCRDTGGYYSTGHEQQRRYVSIVFTRQK
jgi:hypothetical protein